MSDLVAPGRGVLRVTEREARVWRRFWHTSVLTGVLMPLLFVGAIGGGLGDLVDQNRGTVEGVSYLVFVTPGILCATGLQAATGSSLWPVMGGLKWTRTFHAAAATPVSPAQVYLGYVGWIGARLALNATLFVLVAALLGAIPSAWGVLAVPAAVMGGLAFAAPVCAFSAPRRTPTSSSPPSSGWWSCPCSCSRERSSPSSSSRTRSSHWPGSCRCGTPSSCAGGHHGHAGPGRRRRPRRRAGGLRRGGCLGRHPRLRLEAGGVTA